MPTPLPRYRAVRSLVLDTRIGDVGPTVVIHADNDRHAHALARALNAYEDGVIALRRIIELSPPDSECYQIAMATLEQIIQVIVI